ncbi:MAG: hypothetical protein AAB289_01585, partial [Chloroflexota bacterium]
GQSNHRGREVMDQAEREIAGRRRELDEYGLGLLRRLEANLTGQINAVRTGIESIMQDSGRGSGPGPAARN